MDIPQPPAVGRDDLELWVVDGRAGARLTRSITPTRDEVMQWDLVVDTPAAATLELGLGDLPAGHRAWLQPTDGGPLESRRTRVPSGRHTTRVFVVRQVPTATRLLPNYPNPFNPETWLPFELAEAGDVTLTLYDGSGRRVQLISLGRLAAGYYGANYGAVRWDGRNEGGEPAASGAYVAELHVGDSRSTRRVLLLR
jgi:hypothetical protein